MQHPVSPLNDPPNGGGGTDLKLTRTCSRASASLAPAERGEAERASSLFEGGQAAELELAFVCLLSHVHVVLAEAEHAVDELCELPGDGKDGDGSARVACDAPEGGSEGALGSLQGCRGHSQRAGDSICPQTVAPFLEGLASRDWGSGAKAQPRDEVVFGGKGGKVGADFGEHDLRDPGAD